MGAGRPGPPVRGPASLDQGQGYAAALRAIVGAARATAPAVVPVQSLVSTRKDGVLFFLLRRAGMPLVFTAHNVLPHEGTA